MVFVTLVVSKVGALYYHCCFIYQVIDLISGRNVSVRRETGMSDIHAYIHTYIHTYMRRCE